MTLKYSQRSLVVLSLLGVLSAVMTVLSVILIFQQQSQQKAVQESPPSTSALVPAHVWAVLLPVSTVLAALALTLNLSSVVVCLLHGYFSTEVCRGEQDTDRADWFLLDSRAVRHVAIGLFCLGVSVYLAADRKGGRRKFWRSVTSPSRACPPPPSARPTPSSSSCKHSERDQKSSRHQAFTLPPLASGCWIPPPLTGLLCSVFAAMSIFMLLMFEMETGIASACVLSSGILILLLSVIHSLVKASRAAGRYRGDRADTLFQNESGGGGGGAPLSRPCELRVGVDKPRIHRSQSHLQHAMSYPPACGNPRQREPYQPQQYPPADLAADKDDYSGGGSYPRMHRTLSTESGLLQAQVKPWNGVNNEMRSVLARKSGISAKDSTLV
ncbi:unnamed protein product [Menidia menidia]|uniref:(Atlantic silverside) hypothetical protein n=1 Tax=Menidia menidia TaxID=238744 RepID=A0A8S4AAG3_9TELE|nr:unnamed protein product [Menidia menidia]